MYTWIKDFSHRLKVIGGIGGLICFLVSGCSSSFIDATGISQAHSLPTPAGYYSDVAWLKGNQLAFLYAPTSQHEPSEYQIFLHTLGTAEWDLLTVPPAEECHLTRIKRLSRLPNGNLGIIQECVIEREHVIDSEFSLYIWDDQTNTLEVLQRYPVNFYPIEFAYAPDMSELIQGQLGGGIDERLYRINQGGQPEQIFEDFARATSPSWSADGHGIAFFGTETLPEAGFNPFSSLPGIMGQVLYPWDLYLMDADGANVRVILSGVVAGSATQWLSQGDRLSFSGAYKKTDGVWVLDTRTLALTRVWPYGTPYDWSPDGQQMVVIQQEAQDGEQHTHPMIVDVPSLDSD